MRKVNIITVLIIVIGFINVFGQNPSDKGNFGKDNLPSLYDGKLDWKLPLLNTGGRGATAFTPTLKVDATPWKVKSEFIRDDYANQHYYHETISNEKDPDAGYGPGFLVFKREYLVDSQNNSKRTLTRLYFYNSGGGRTELIDNVYKGSPLIFSHTGYRGYQAISYDGSSMTFVSDTQIRDIYSNGQNPPSPLYPTDAHPSGFLKSANGVTYRIDSGLVSWIRDTNGNKISFSYYPQSYGSSFPNAKLKDITDSNGRKVEFEYDVQDILPYGICDRIIYKGFGGQTRIIRVSKKSLGEVLRIGETLKNVNVLFPDFEGEEGNCWGQNHSNCVVRELQEVSGIYNPIVVSSIWYPDGSGYKLRYNSYGEIARVENSFGSYTDYNYLGVGTEIGLNIKNPWDETGSSYIHRRIKESLVYKEGGILEAKDTIDIQKVANNTVTTAISYDGQTNTKLSVNKKYFLGYFDPGFYSPPTTPKYYSDWRDGKEYKAEVLDENGNVIKREEVDWQNGNYYPFQSYIGGGLESDPRTIETRSIDVPSNLVAKTTFSYDAYNNVTDTFSYDFGIGQAGQFLRRNHTDYITTSNYINDLHAKRLTDRSWVSSDIAGENKVALTQNEYDNYSEYGLINRQNVVGHDSVNYGINRTIRGNVTKTTSYSNASDQTGGISTKNQYDILGNIVKSINANGDFSTIDYSDRFGSPDNEARSNTAPSNLNGQSTFAFPTSVTNVLGNTAYSQVDYWLGVNVNTEDLNGVVSSFTYSDPLGRLTQTVSAIGTAKANQSSIIYDDANRRVETKSDLFSLNDNLVKTENFSDSLGRKTEIRKYENGGYIVTKTEYDALGRDKRTSSPYRPWQNESPVWTETVYDILGRTIENKTADGATVNSEYFGNSVTVIDQSGKKRRSISNAQGVIRVDEPNQQGELGSIENPNQPTYYQYNTLGNLVKVTQGNQTRYFLYNSIGQLIRVRQPEQGTNPSLTIADPITGNNQWSTGTTYDLNGNAATLTNAKGVTTTNTYDAANRPLSITYTDNTPTVNYTYENANVPYSKNKLTKITNGVSTTEYTSFDILGMLLTHKQTTDGEVYATSYKYNLRGDITEEVYPSGRVVKTSFDNNGAISSVESRKNNQSADKTYANQISYNSQGLITSMRLGNGLFESMKYNDRLQLIEAGLGNSNSTNNLWKINNNFGTTDNNGNIKSQTIHAGTVTFTQTYQYDSLNRLTEAKEISNNLENWKQTFGYDRFGNRINFSQVIEGQQLTINNLTLPQIDINNNRFSAGQGYEYDQNGNLIKDPQNRDYIYNGNNIQTEVRDVNNQIIGKYFYDGSGLRVKKITNSETTVFVYNASKKLVAEYSTLINSNPQITYLTKDQLGTPRIKTNARKEIISRNDYLPFGENLYTSQRNQSLKYVQDSIKQGFTGLERDLETGLDFAQARYYNNQHGRFTAVDPLLASGKSGNPQTFNRYVYCVNRPLIAIDPMGLSHIIVLVGKDNNARILFMTKEMSYIFSGRTEGQYRDRTKENGDTPYGFYKYDKVSGGYKDYRHKSKVAGPGAWGLGVVHLSPTDVGEGNRQRRTGVFIHGGGGSDPFALDQSLSGDCGCFGATNGCIRMKNEDVISLIKAIKAANAAGDYLDNTFIGDNKYLKNLANEKDSKGRWKYPELRSLFYQENASNNNNNRRQQPTLKFQDNDGTAVNEPPLDNEEDDSEGYGLNSMEDDDYEEEEEDNSQDVEQPPSGYG